jgi:DNA-binding IclR family transcriptional regulator
MRRLSSWFTPPTEARARVLEVLRKQPTIDVRVLAVRAGLPLPRINAVLSRLEREDFVKRFSPEPLVCMVQLMPSV